MSTPANHWKIGLFVLLGFVLSLVTIGFLAAQSLRKQTVEYVTFFDESVQGLEVGSPVKYRGVTIGNVSRIDIAPDRRHVGVQSSMGVTEIAHLGLSEGTGRKVKIRLPENVRAQLASQGITGVKFLSIDFFDVKDNPLPELPFAVPDNYLPAAVSTMKSLEDSVVRAVARIPEIADNLNRITTRIDLILAEVETQRIPEHIAVMLRQAGATLSSVNGAVKELEMGKTSGLARDTIGKLNAVLLRLDSTAGLLARAETSASSIGEAATSVKGMGLEAEQTLRDIQEVTTAIRHVAEALERDPDMLVKGRPKPK